MHLSKLHTPFSHIPSQRPLYCPHNGNPNTQERFFHANVKSIQEKEKEAVWDSLCTQRKQDAIKCLRRQPDNLVAFIYAASSISTWKTQKDMTPWSKLNPTSPQNHGQSALTNKTVIIQLGVISLQPSSVALIKQMMRNYLNFLFFFCKNVKQTAVRIVSKAICN